MRRFGLIGYPLSHSFSKQFFEEKFRKESLIDCSFENFSISSLEQLGHLLKSGGDKLKGLAVTIPYKKSVISFLDDISYLPTGLSACNCIKIVNGKLIGFNTDIIGFEKSITPLLKPIHDNALILGNGGATEAVIFVLKRIGIEFKIVSRKIHDGSHLTYHELTKEIIQDHPLIVNTTPLGMYPDIDKYPLIPYENISTEHLLYDLIYNPKKTCFLQMGEANGASIKNGGEMLAIQAEENWRLWNQDF